MLTFGRQYEGQIFTLNSVIAEMKEVHEFDVQKVTDLQHRYDHSERAREEKDQAIQKLHRNLGAAQTCASESMHQLQVGIMPERASQGEWCMFLIILSCIHVSAEGQGLLSSRCLRQSSVKSAFFVSCKSPGSTT